MVYASGLSGTDPVTGEPCGDLKRQVATALQHMRRLVEKAGGSLDNVGRAVGFCTRVEDRDLVDQVWMDVFPDPNDKPAFKVLLADLPPGQLARIDCVALLGERRTRIDIPNVSAHDPTVRIGNLVFTSRCHGNDPATGKIVDGGLEAQARQTFENLATLVKLAGGTEANITQITTFGREARLPARGEEGFRSTLCGPEPASTLQPDHKLRLAQHGHRHRSDGGFVGEPDERR